VASDGYACTALTPSVAGCSEGIMRWLGHDVTWNLPDGSRVFCVGTRRAGPAGRRPCGGLVSRPFPRSRVVLRCRAPLRRCSRTASAARSPTAAACCGRPHGHPFAGREHATAGGGTTAEGGGRRAERRPRTGRLYLKSDHRGPPSLPSGCGPRAARAWGQAALPCACARVAHRESEGPRVPLKHLIVVERVNDARHERR